MSDIQRIHIDDVHVSVRPEELDSILGLRNTFDYFEIMGNYVSSYLELGWVVKLVIPHLDIALDVDFRQVREVWNQGLTDLAVKGVHTCLMGYTGSASNLMVLEIHGKNAEKALVLGRDWRARCVIQIGEEKEQHFFTWPPTLALPDRMALETMDIQVFGEGGRVALPPSLIPGAEESIRWLSPPWENPPCPPTPRLLEFLQGHVAPTESGDQDTGAEFPPWEEILPQISAHAGLMQTLLTPTADSESYYQALLRAARSAGLRDERLLLSLLWHAPLGKARHEPHSLPWLKDLIAGKPEEEISDLSQIQDQLTGLLQELSRTLTDLNKEREKTFKESFKNPSPIPAQAEQFGLKNLAWPALPKNSAPEPCPAESPHLTEPGSSAAKPSLCFIHPSIFPQGEIPVNRKQYEAMIYELGRLGALQKYNNRMVREANSLKTKIDAQRQEEINHLRQLLREKKTKKWW